MPEVQTSGFQVLIVDDEPTLREIIQQEFERRGWTTSIASGGFEALDFLKGHAVDLIVSDVRMAQGSGLQLLEGVLKRRESNRHPLVVLMSGYSEVDEYKAINMGASAFFLKPFQLTDFVDQILAMHANSRAS